MGLETGQYISDLDPTNPISGDQVAEGDNHIRLLKTVLKNTFPNASKPMYIPDMAVKSANFTAGVLESGKTFIVDTTAGVITATMPTLTSGDAGWSCYVMKAGSNHNAVMIAPPLGGTIVSGNFSLSTARRCIPNQPRRVFWTGGTWIAERAIDVPVGSVLTFFGTTLPYGFEWPDGAALGHGSYPEYVAAIGGLTTYNLQGRSVVMKEAAATLLTTGISGVDGATLGAVGGSQLMHSHGHTATSTVSDPTHTHGVSHNAPVSTGHSLNSGPFSAPHPNPATITIAYAGTGISVSTSIGAAGSGASQNVQPTIVMNKILVVE